MGGTRAQEVRRGGFWLNSQVPTFSGPATEWLLSCMLSPVVCKDALMATLAIRKYSNLQARLTSGGNFYARKGSRMAGAIAQLAGVGRWLMGKCLEVIRKLSNDAEEHMKDMLEIKASDCLTDPLTPDRYQTVMQD